MTLHLDSAAITQLCDEGVALDAARLALSEQRAGRCELPRRIDVNVPAGFFRVMPAALGDYTGAKIMTLAKGVGNRYLLLVYRQNTGELVATLDAAEVTRLRTAATTALAGSLLRPQGSTVLGVIGSGFEAEGHLRAFARLWPLEKVRVYSRSADRRREFADRLGADLGIDVEPAADVAEVTGGSPVTVLCTKSTEPVVDGAAFAPGSVVLSIGSTRPDLRELDDATFARARAVLVDDAATVHAESGDVRSAVASGAISAEALVSMPAWTAERAASTDGERNLFVFKSVGTALQDLALACEILEAATEEGVGRQLGDLAELKLTKDARRKAPVPEGAP